MITTIHPKQSSIRSKLNEITRLDINLLIILCIISQHSFAIKSLGLALLLALNISELKNIRPREIPLFYTIIPLLEILKFIFLNEQYSKAHLAQFSVGFSYWICSFVACWFLYNSVKQESAKNISNTLKLFVVLNFCFSIYQYIQICRIEHVINPYNTYHDHPYGISSGDLIYGLFNGVHLPNAVVCLFLLLYYTDKKQIGFALLSAIPLLLTGNNYSTIIYFVSAAVLFITTGENVKRLIIAGTAVFIIAFYWFVTPLNSKYMGEKLFHVTMTLPNALKDLAQKEAPIAPQNIPVPASHEVNTTTSAQATVQVPPTFDFDKQSGKIRSYFQTKDYLRSSVKHFFFGSGMGGFSSKLAFNSSGVMEGSSLTKHLPPYQTEAFKKNHKALYSHLKTLHVAYHSEANRPFSVYNQLLGEYGVLGFLVFICGYLWYFMKRFNKRTYALPVFVALLFLLNLDYFIEELNILFFFELLMFIDIKERKQPAS